MKDSCYLIMNRRGVVKMAKVRFSDVEEDQIVVKLNIEVPDDVFKEPQPTVNVMLTKQHILPREAVTVEPQRREVAPPRRGTR